MEIWLPSKRSAVAPAVYSRGFENLTKLTFGALRKNHVASPGFEDITKITTKPRLPRVVSNAS